MSKDPAILFYTADFLIGTSVMTNEQTGMYIKLLCHQHQRGRLSMEDVETICGRLDEKVIDKFSKDKNGKLFNKRMEDEADKRQKYSKSRSDNRRKGLKNQPSQAETYDKDMNNICQTYEHHMENENENENEVVIINKRKDKNIIPPTPQMVLEYCLERNSQVDPRQFFDFYETKGWKVGKEKMKDWQACIRTWEKRETKKGGSFIGILSDLYEDE